jgi:hypothetical protein
MRNQEPKENNLERGNFYTYVKKVAKITESNKIRSIIHYSRLDSFMKKRAQKYSAYITKKN